jgi:hypothetical protein
LCARTGSRKYWLITMMLYDDVCRSRSRFGPAFA